MAIIIGADFVPTESNQEYFSNRKMEKLILGELLRIIFDADFKIFNLEVPLANTLTPINKCGPHLIAKTSTVEGYKQLGVNMLVLGNNHILDHGTEGLLSTIDTLNRASIEYVGAGNNITKAAESRGFIYGNRNIGIYACSEHEFSIATDTNPGANPFDPLYSFDHVEMMTKKYDYIIVLYHGGKEHYRYPSPRLQEVCRRFADKGADLIICQHSHCIGCEENYKGKKIVYGQGNFLFDRSQSEYWETGLLISIDENTHISYIPIVKKNECVELTDGAQSQKILDEYFCRSKEIQELGFIKEQYNKFSYEMMDYYLNSFAGKKSIAFRVIDRLTNGKYRKYQIKKKYGIDELLHIYNYCLCEAHIELISHGLENRIYGKIK